jgi:tetratricopeptide (TPR) repeat protein
MKRSGKYSALAAAVFCLLHLCIIAQTPRADSLRSVLERHLPDSVRFRALLDFSAELRHIEPLQALDASKQALAIALAGKNKKRLATAHSRLGLLYGDIGNFDRAIEHNLKALQLQEELGDTLQIAGMQLNVGIVYNKHGNMEVALHWLEKALTNFKKMKNKYGEAYAYNNLAMIRRKQGRHKEAFELYSHSLKIKEELKDTASLGNGYLNIGLSCEDMGEVDKARDYYHKAIEIFRITHNKKGFAGVYNNLGQLAISQGKIAEGKALLLLSLEFSKEVSSKEDAMQAHVNLSKVYESEENYTEALKHYNLFRDYKDSLLNQTALEKIANLQAVYETEKQDAELKRQEKDNLIASERLSRNKILIVAAVTGIVLVLLLLLLVINQYRYRIRANRMLAETNDRINTRRIEITDSISYARRIQESILPRFARFNDIIPGSFLLHKPRQIVSGDFYWIHREGDSVYAAVADNLQHGVPGAFISMVGVNILNSAVEDERITDLSQLLRYVEKGVGDMLNEPEGARRLNLSVCKLDMNSGEVEFASTDNPLFLVNSKGVTQVDAGKDRGLVNRLRLHKGDTIYMFTDGYVDQMGGGEGKKMLTRKVGEILFNNWPIPMDKQKEGLLREFESWRGNYEQVDDVLVMGIRY